MNEEQSMSGKESLELITSMIQKAKASYHETGVPAILWGTTVAVASIVHYLQVAYKFTIGFDIWLIVLAAIIPQVIISIKEKKKRRIKKYEDDAVNTVWMAYGITLFGVLLYNQLMPSASQHLARQEGWELIRHYTDHSKPDEVIKPFTPSIFSLLILVYALPTFITGIVKKFKPMLYGAIITYILFIASCFTAIKYDLLMSAGAAIVCWLIPGIILRRRYLTQKEANV